MTTTPLHRYHVELVRSLGGWQAVCRCGWGSIACAGRADAASYGTEHCRDAETVAPR